MTREALADKARVSAKAVSDLERDPTRRPRLTTVALLADARALSTDDRAALLAAARPNDMPPPGQVTGPAYSALPRPLAPLLGHAGVTAGIAELL